MSRFVTRLMYYPAKRDGFFVLADALVYDSDYAGMRVTAPVGFETNFVTGRKLLFVRRIVTNDMNKAAVVHDVLYATGEVDRDIADEVFHEAMLVAGVARWRAWLAWCAVRLCGEQFYRK